MGSMSQNGPNRSTYVRTHSDPIEVKSRLLEDILDDRLNKGWQNLPSSIFYRAMKQTVMYLFISKVKYTWFKARGIEIPSDYSVYDERNTLERGFYCWNYIVTTCIG
jgi:hypothetical protein